MARSVASRRETVLRIIVNEYVATAQPVASETIWRSYDLGVSPATIRNDMAYLEREGYIIRPHTSAGGVPTDKGYRRYVELLAQKYELPFEEQYRIRELFREVGEGLERWLRLAAMVMSHLVRSAAVVTFPKPNRCRFRHLELVELHEFLALMVLVLSEAILKRRLLSFGEPVTQAELTAIADRLNAICFNLTSSEVRGRRMGLAPREKQVLEAVLDIMSAEDEVEYEEPYFEGIRLMLDQPEFARREKMLSAMELFETKEWISSALARRSTDVGVQVVIGGEHGDEIFQDLSLVFSRYGVPGRASGALGVIGPTRMDYRRAISTVDYMSQVLSDLVSRVCTSD